LVVVNSATPRIRLLVNPQAGGGRAARRTEAALNELEGHGLTVQTAVAKDREEVTELAALVAREGETVVTLGGDGIAGAAADGLRAVPGAVLGIIPAGRGNDLARVLGIPKNLKKACAVVANGTVRAMDLGEVDGRAFVGIASVGFDSEANRVANMAPRWIGSGVYAYGALRALMRWHPATFQVELVRPATPAEPAGENSSAQVNRTEMTGYSVAVANSRCFGGGMRLAPQALLDDGVLELVAIARMARPLYAWHLRKVFSGTHTGLEAVRTDSLTEVVISADRPFTMYADGDPIGELPVRVRVLPQAIGVLTGASPLEAFSRAPRAQGLKSPPPQPAGVPRELAGGRSEGMGGSHTLAR
jgi:YegS/Rv2252/BmrU family lipid kinase